MAFEDFQEKQRLNKQKAILRDYFLKHSGYALCLSDDLTFTALVSSTLKDLAVQGRLLTVITDTVKTLKVISEAFEAGKKPVLLIERVLNTVGDTSFLIRQFKDSYPEMRVMVMTTTADKDRIMLLHEAGADNFIVKPLSSVDLLDKMADTLRPPSPIRQLLDKARSFISKNSGNEALKITQKVLEIKPDSAAGYVILGDSLRIFGNSDKAKVAYERACKYSGDYLEPLQRLADLAGEADNKEAKLEYLKRMDAISPLNAQRKVEIGELLVALGKTESAAEIFDTAVSRAYKDAIDQVAAMAQKIAVSLQDSDPVQAEKYLRKCLDLKGDDLTVDDLATFNQLGISLRKQGRWQDSIVEYKKALNIAPKAEGLFYNMGMAYAEGGEFETAVNCMQKALSINPKLPWGGAVLAYNMGMIFSKGYTKDKALQCMEIALKLDAGHEAAAKMLEHLKEEAVVTVG
jgi:tetratricopeptide (TPR) repeat protein